MTDQQSGDIFCVILGCDEIMLLREASPEHYKVIGPCYVHGLWDGEGLLGPLQKPWTLKYVKDKTGVDVPRFFNGETGSLQFEDPRLGPLPAGWRQVVLDRTMSDPLSMEWFKHEESGEVLNYDPRVRVDELKARGVEVRSFLLV